MEPDHNPDLIHAHTCRSCGHQQLREDVDSRAAASGIIECPICGTSCPLNVQIVDSGQVRHDGQRKRPASRMMLSARSLSESLFRTCLVDTRNRLVRIAERLKP